MKCTIPGANVKVLARAIHALSKIGDELYVEPDVDSLSFRSVNASRSAYASYTFHRPFFAFYKHEPLQVSSSQEDSAKCKISMKSCMPVFRSPVMLDRKVENCIMRQESDGSKLIFEMRCRHGIVKTHFLPIIECETLQVVYTKNNASNCLRAQMQLFSDAVHNFQSTQEEVTLAVTSQKTFLRSYIDNSLNPAKMKHTELSLDAGEFEKYSVESETSVTFCLKEFRALLSFAEATVLPVEACFDHGGRPIVFTLRNENSYDANFVLSTLSPDKDSRPSTPQQTKEVSINSPQSSVSLLSRKLTNHKSNIQKTTPTEVLNISNQLQASKPQSASRNKSTDLEGSVANVPVMEGSPSLLNGTRAQLQISSTSSLSLNVRESDNEDEANTVPPSPQPSPKRRCCFYNFFENTFDPNLIPGHNIILAEDSGGEDI